MARSLTTAFTALLAGASITLALAPFDLKLLVLLGPALLYLIQRHQAPRQSLFSGYCFGLGFWGAGVSWVYVSINTYGNASALLATALTALFVMALALLFALQGWLFAHLARNAGQRWLIFTVVWVGFEWLRSWLLTGFPWLYLGYAVLDTPLERWAPLFGIWWLSLILVLLATASVAGRAAGGRFPAAASKLDPASRLSRTESRAGATQHTAVAEMAAGPAETDSAATDAAQSPAP
jgi:apolipoprotein N-acyltransferase